MSSRRATVRAVLIAVVLVAQGIDALPLPSGVEPRRFKNPTAKREFARWVEILGSVGIDTNRSELESGMRGVFQPMITVRNAAMKPIKPVNKLLGTGQAWALFAYPDTDPHRLVIEGRARGGDWVPLFRALEPEHDFLAPQIRFRRLRGIYDAQANRASRPYTAFVRWAAGKAFDTDPELDEVRVSFERSSVLAPGEGADPGIRIRHVRTLTRAQLAQPGGDE